MKDAASPTPLRVLIVSADNVASVLVSRLFERLGHPRPERLTAFPDAVARARCDLLMVDADLEGAAVAVDGLQAVADRPRIVAMSSSDAVIPADARLRKPLTLAALGAALASEAVAGPASPAAAVAAAWTELRDQFGSDGAAALVATLDADLPAQRQRMAAALREDDLAALKRVAHALRGVGLQLGAKALVRLGTDCEQAASEGQAGPARALGERLIRQHELLVEGLRDAAAGR